MPRCNFRFFEACVREVLFRGPAAPDRRRAAGGSDRHPDRGGSGPFNIDDHQVGASQLRRVGGVSAVRGTLYGPGTDATAQATAPHDGRRHAERNAGKARLALEPRANCPLAEDPASADPDMPHGIPAPADPALPPAAASGPGFTTCATCPKTVDRTLNQREVRPHGPAHRLSHRK